MADPSLSFQEGPSAAEVLADNHCFVDDEALSGMTDTDFRDANEYEAGVLIRTLLAQFPDAPFVAISRESGGIVGMGVLGPVCARCLCESARCFCGEPEDVTAYRLVSPNDGEGER